MTDSEEILPEKTSLDKAVDMVAGLKEMIHYAKTNIEKISEYWLFMEDEAGRKDLANMLDELLDKQSSLHNDLEETTNGIEMEINRIKNEGGDSLWKSVTKLATSNRLRKLVHGDQITWHIKDWIRIVLLHWLSINSLCSTELISLGNNHENQK